MTREIPGELINLEDDFGEVAARVPKPKANGHDLGAEKIASSIIIPQSAPNIERDPISETDSDILDEQGPLVFDPINWEGKEIPVRKWLVPGLIPWHVPTMLSGMGGLGKTLLGIQLCHAAAVGQKWIGKEVKPVKVLGVFCEDDADELQRRLDAININSNTRFGDLENLRLMIRDGMHSSLMDFDGPYGNGEESPFFRELIDQAKAFGAQCLVLDSLYNFFQGNENNRVQVSQFVYCLKRIAKECDAALVFIAHPSKSGISTGEGYAGSTAWHDAVRARLYLTKEEKDGQPTRLLLKTMKANYAAGDGEIEVYYQGGMLWPQGHIADNQPAAFREDAAETAFLNGLAEVRAQGRNVSDATNSKAYAAKILLQASACAGFSQKEIGGAMQRLFKSGIIVVKTTTDSYRNEVKGIFQVAERSLKGHNIDTE